MSTKYLCITTRYVTASMLDRVLSIQVRDTLVAKELILAGEVVFSDANLWPRTWCCWCPDTRLTWLLAPISVTAGGSHYGQDCLRMDSFQGLNGIFLIFQQQCCYDIDNISTAILRSQYEIILPHEICWLWCVSNSITQTKAGGWMNDTLWNICPAIIFLLKNELIELLNTCFLCVIWWCLWPPLPWRLWWG